MKKRNITHSKSIKLRKKSLKIPRQHIPLKHPAAAAAEWTEIHINGKDVANILLTAKQKIVLSTDQKCAIAEKIQKATNSYIQDWMLNKHSSPKEFAAWAQRISDAAQTLLTCLGSPPSQKWHGIPLETKYNLLIEGIYDWDSTPRPMQKIAGLPDDTYQAIEKAGAAIFVVKQIASAAVDGYKHVSKMRKKEKESLKIPLKSNHQADDALRNFFAKINEIYEFTTGKKPTASNGSSKANGSGKGDAVIFSAAILDVAAIKIKDSISQIDMTDGADEKSVDKIVETLKRLAQNHPKIARLIQQAKNHQLHKR